MCTSRVSCNHLPVCSFPWCLLVLWWQGWVHFLASSLNMWWYQQMPLGCVLVLLQLRLLWLGGWLCSYEVFLNLCCCWFNNNCISCICLCKSSLALSMCMSLALQLLSCLGVSAFSLWLYDTNLYWWYQPVCQVVCRLSLLLFVLWWLAIYPVINDIRLTLTCSSLWGDFSCVWWVGWVFCHWNL